MSDDFISTPSSSIMGSTPRPKPDSQPFGFKSHPSLFPNLPVPINGMIKTYDSKHRTFSRPYSAKTVFFYKEGDHYFTGLRVPISKARYRTIDSLMDDLNHKVTMPFGVRRLHTPYGRTPIDSLDQLQHMGKYVASSSKICRGVNFDQIEKHRQRIELANRRWRQLEVQNNYWNELNSTRYHAKFRNNHGFNFLPITAKQMFFVLNGHPSRIYRALLNPTKRVEFEVLLEEVSRGLEVAIFKVYTYSGDRITSVDQLFDLKEARVLAVPRHERPILNGMSLSSLPTGSTTNRSVTLPPIYKKTFSSRTGLSNTPPSNETKSTGRSYHENNNSIERPKKTLPQRNYVGMGTKRTFMPSINTSSKLQRQTSMKIAKKVTTGTKNGTGAALRKRTKTSGKVKLPAVPVGGTGSTADESDSGRPRSLEEKSTSATHDEEDTDDYPEGPTDDETEDEDAYKSSRDTEFRESAEEHEDDDEHDEPMYVDPDKEDAEMQEASPIGREYKDKEVEAAITIQKYTKGYLTRKHMKDQRDTTSRQVSDIPENEDFFEDDKPGTAATGEEEHEPENELEEYNDEDEAMEVDEPPIDEEERKRREQAATTIQKYYRGFRVRKQYEELHKDPKKLAQVRQNYETLPEEERQQRHEAAIVIQKHYRGYGVRRNLANARNRQESLAEKEDGYGDEELQAAMVVQKHYRGYRTRKILQEENDDTPPMMPEELEEDEEEHKKRHEAAITIQKHYRGFRTRKNLADGKINEMEQLNAPDEMEEKQADSEGEHEHDPDRLDTAFLEHGHSAESVMVSEAKDEGFTYTVSVYTGNRWAADTEADLYLILHGELGESEKHHLTQDAADPKFRQNRMDSFHISTKPLGALKKVTIGHENAGYGAGVFIDKVLVTENISDGRQYLFCCQKWLDSCQVDGKIERSLKCSAVHYLASIPEDNARTKGRWELIFHSGDDKGKGGTTSTLTVVGYGTNGQGVTSQLYDSNFVNVPSTSLIQALPIQVDFGDIGDLLKIRVEIDGSGDKPDYFLDYVELKDLDTEERMDAMCGKWLKWESNGKGAQSFRELIVLRADVEPLQIVTYEGKIRVTKSKIASANPLVKVELFGELGETGLFSVILDGPMKKKGTLDIPFKVECVSLGRILGARIYFEPTNIGAELYEGFSLIQKFLGDNVPVSVGDEWLVSYMLIRESAHAPYRYVLNQARVRPRTVEDDPYVKELLVTEMEGLSTKISKKKAQAREKSHWILSMSLGDHSNLLPKVTLCGEEGSAEMEVLNTTPTDWIISYSLKDIDLGLLKKIRVEVDQTQRLNVLPEDEETEENVQNQVFIKKMRLCDTVNGDQLRFPAANVELIQYSVFEFPAIWPDHPPIQNVLYDVTVNTGECESDQDFKVHLNLFGEKGDIGYRLLSIDLLRPYHFEPHSTQHFELEAVSIGDITTAEITVDTYDSSFKWQCKEIVVTDAETSMFYIFNFSKAFTPETRRQNCSVSLLTDAL